MSAMELKRTNPRLWADLAYVGLMVAGKQAINGTRVTGGKFTFQLDEVSLTGEVALLVTDSGLRNREVSTAVKKFTKAEVLPDLIKFCPTLAGKHSFKIVLHFSSGVLNSFSLA